MNAALSNCCEEHLAEFEAELLRHLRECVAQQQEADGAADEDAAPSSVHCPASSPRAIAATAARRE